MKKTISLPLIAFAVTALAGLACSALTPRVTTEVISTTAPVLSASPTPKSQINLEAGNYTNYRDSIDSLWFVGEVLNTGEASAQNVQVVISLIDDNGSVIGTGSETLLYVGANGKFPYKILIFNAPSEWSEVKIQIQGESYSENALFAPYIKLQIDNVSGKPGDFGGYNLTGVVKNTGDKTASLVYISAIAYDEQGQVIDAGWTFATLDQIAPGSDSPFTLDFSNLKNAPASYEIFSVSSLSE
ncbi:MAG: hypothetical protein HYZ22_09385 [Chloroflexi bacterium]|nr:hypothetical protein [Chloroflexota bacterium]